MRRWLLALLLVPSLLPVVADAGGFADAQRRYARVRDAHARRGAEVARAFRDAGAAWPSRGIYVRVFKSEGVVELWAAPPRASQGWVRVRDFPICRSSGDLGPKRRQGDGQVPEGFYHVDRFNPFSSFHLSLGLSYPNAVDRARAGTAPPGGDIFVHGSCVTIGCIPLRDEPMEALYLAAVAARDGGQRAVPVHVFPCRFGEVACELRLLAYPQHAAFWATLRPAFEAFEERRRPPRVRIRDRRYRLR